MSSYCREMSDGWMCTLADGHQGEHFGQMDEGELPSPENKKRRWANKNDKFYRPEQVQTQAVNVRKTYPMFSGLLKYFPDALMEVAHVSFVGNEQHNPGQPLHWDRSKSTDEPDALLRHLKDAGTLDTDGLRHTAKVAWRALALLQKELEADRAL